MGCYADMSSDDNDVLWSLLYCVCALVGGWAWKLLSMQKIREIIFYSQVCEWPYGCLF